MKIMNKLIAAFLFGSLFLVLTGVIGVTTANKISTNANVILNDLSPLKDVSMEAIISILETRDISAEFLLNEEGLDDIEAEIFEYIEDYDMWMAMIEYGTDSSEFIESHAGEMYVNDGLTIKVKKGSEADIELSYEADALHALMQENVENLVDAHKTKMEYYFYHGDNFRDIYGFVEEVIKRHNIWLYGLSKSVAQNKEFTGPADGSTCFYGTELKKFDIKDKELQRMLEETWDNHLNLHSSALDVNAVNSLEDKVRVFNEVTVPASVLLLTQLDDIQVYLKEKMELLDSQEKQSMENLDMYSSQIIDVLSQLEENIDHEMEMAIVDADKSKKSSMVILITLIILGTVLGVAVGIFVAKMVATPIKEVSNISKKMADGDLTQVVDAKLMKSKDETGELAKSFSTMILNLKQLIVNIKTNADSSAASSSELSASAEEVNASVEQVSSTVSEIAKGAQELSKNATSAAEKSKKTKESSEVGAKSAGEVSTKMQGISATTKEGADKVKSLGDKSKKIGDIIDTINNISEQTNLLALNAAIEAARAGEAGRGFAVVADEVRKLAEESQKATGTISELISSIQTEIGSSVESMDKNNQQVEEGMASVNGAVLAFQEIPTLVENVNQAIQGISAVAEENAAGAEEVNASVEQVTSAMQQVASTAEQLSKGAETLKDIVSKFKV